MFEELSQRFEDAVRGLRGQGAISENNVDAALKSVRRARIEADVSLQVVQDFVADVRSKALGAEVVRGISPDQQFIKLVHNELVEVMGGANAPLAQAATKPTVLVGREVVWSNGSRCGFSVGRLVVGWWASS
jgi:signal recognition particle subunit SRP54